MVETDPTKLLDKVVPVHKTCENGRNEFFVKYYLSAIDARLPAIV